MTRKSEALLRFWRYRAETGKLPGRASRGCAESNATLKQASCGVILGARPSAVPGRLTAFGGLGSFRKKGMLNFQTSKLPDFPFPVFPCCGAAFPIRRGRPKALRRHGTAGETQFQPDATWLRQMRIAHPPPVSQNRRGSATITPHGSAYLCPAMIEGLF